MKNYLSALLLAAAFIAPTTAQSQSTQIATLTHDNEVILFTGANALAEAKNVASDGDVITLSPGTYSGTTIAKCITIRGAEMFPEENGTIINGNLIITASDTGNNQSVNLEGIYINDALYLRSDIQTNVTKCQMNILSEGGISSTHITLINSFINEVRGRWRYSKLNFINSVVLNAEPSDEGINTYENCYVDLKDGKTTNTAYSTYKNCIINCSGNSKLYDYNLQRQIFINNYIISPVDETFEEATSINNTYLKSAPEDLWKDERYVLSEQYSQNWLGNDGTQVGIYGGMMPFDPIPSNPQISKFNVASKTSIDGKLSVEIEVKVAE